MQLIVGISALFIEWLIRIVVDVDIARFNDGINYQSNTIFHISVVVVVWWSLCFRRTHTHENASGFVVSNESIIILAGNALSVCGIDKSINQMNVN